MTWDKDIASLALGPGSATQTLMDLRASEDLVVVIVVAIRLFYGKEFQI